MPQIFRPSTGLVLNLVLLAGVAVMAALVFAWREAIADRYGIGDPVPQPVPFSHKHHVAEEGIDCRYCHSDVEQSAFAGIPANDVCMTCHSVLFRDASVLAPLRASFRGGKPLAWRRVNKLPDFVYFDHGIHVAKGVGCVTCHGRVDQMPLTWRARSLAMQWCLQCHRHPEQHVRPREHVFEMAWQPPPDRAALGRRLVAEYGIHADRVTDCSVCHR